MLKTKAKNIDYIATELKNKFNKTPLSATKIGIVTCQDNFDNNYTISLANIVKSEILKNGVDAEIIVMPSISERFRIFNTDNFVLNCYKTQIANFLELLLFDKSFDGLVFIPSGFECSLGLILCSIRLNLPTLFLSTGISQTKYGHNLNDLLSYAGKISQAQKSIFDFEEKLKKFCEFSGTGSSFSTENIFYCLLEIMELSTKNNSTIISGTYEKEEQARETANLIVTLSKNHLPLKKMINNKSLSNAVMLNFCLGGSPYIIDALSQIAKEADLDFDIHKILNLGKNVPVLFDTILGVEKFSSYGGVWSLLKTMIKNKNIDANYKTFFDTTLADETKRVLLSENFATPIKKESLMFFKGNVAEKFAVLKTINLPENFSKGLFKAKVFSNDQEACNAVLNDTLTENCAIIIKDCGKKSDTGASVISQTAIALESVGQEKNHIIITDGFIVDDTKAICICCVQNDNVLKIINNDDEIEIDFIKGKINLNLSTKDILKRQKKYIKETRLLPKYLTQKN